MYSYRRGSRRRHRRREDRLDTVEELQLVVRFHLDVRLDDLANVVGHHILDDLDSLLDDVLDDLCHSRCSRTYPLIWFSLKLSIHLYK